MVSGRNGGILLTFRGGGVGVIAGGRKESSWRGRRGDEVVKTEHALEQRGVATRLLFLWCREQALRAFTV
jgi:hypothetical protein